MIAPDRKSVPELAHALRDQTRRRLLEFAWREWTQMGLSGRRPPSDSRAMDPEALLLFTIEVSRADPRLFDETLDWAATNGALLSLTRLRHLKLGHTGDVNLVDATLAWISQANPGLHWRMQAPQSPPTPIDVFDPGIAAFSPETDPVFSAYGFRRPPVQRSRKSEPPDCRLPINFAFQLRSLFGVGTRSEAMRILLTCDEQPLNAADIAEETAFTKRNVSEALLAFVKAGVVKARWAGNERLFTIYRTKWAQVLEHGPTSESLPHFMPWIHILRALTAVDVWLERHFDDSWSPYMASSRARALVAGLASDLAKSGLPVDQSSLPAGDGGWVAFQKLVEALVQLAEVARKSGDPPK